MLDMAVYTTITDEAEKVEPAIAINGSLESTGHIFDLVQFALFDGLINSNDILPHHSTSTDVQVANFRISHEPFRESDCEGRCFKLCVTLCSFGSFFCEAVHVGSFGSGNSISVRR